MALLAREAAGPGEPEAFDLTSRPYGKSDSVCRREPRAEIYYKTPGKRRFAVLLEDRRVLENYDPCSSGFATATRESFEVDVTDGILDLEFIPDLEKPKISAIEIEVR